MKESFAKWKSSFRIGYDTAVVPDSNMQGIINKCIAYYLSNNGNLPPNSEFLKFDNCLGLF